MALVVVGMQQRPAAGSVPAGEPWQAIDLGPFSFMLPPDMERTDARGSDSLVAGYQNQNCQVSLEWGVFSTFSTSFGDPQEYEAEITEIDGREARIIVSARPRTGEFAVYVGVHFPHVREAMLRPSPLAGLGPARLTLEVNCREWADRETALRIVRSIMFS